MAAAESLKATHGVGSNVQGMLKAMEDRIMSGIGMLQGVDDRTKNIGDKAISSAKTVPLTITVLIVYVIRRRAIRTTDSPRR
jgi:hypothetical protein